MVADPMTEGLSLEKFREHIAKVGMVGPKDVQGVRCYMGDLTRGISGALAS